MRCAVVLGALLVSSGCLGGPVEVATKPRPQLMTFFDTTAFPELLVELDHMPTVVPSDDAVVMLVEALKITTGRHNITVTKSVIDDPAGVGYGPGNSWTNETLDALAARTSDEASPGMFSRGSTAVVHVIYVHGSYTKTTPAGLAHNGTAFMLTESPTPQPPGNGTRYTERATLIHEVGHLMGLVNDGVAMVNPHEDPESRHHSSNVNSVMYRSIDAGELLFARLDPERAPPWSFDTDDLADLRGFQQRLAPSQG